MKRQVREGFRDSLVCGQGPELPRKHTDAQDDNFSARRVPRQGAGQSAAIRTWNRRPGRIRGLRGVRVAAEEAGSAIGT